MARSTGLILPAYRQGDLEASRLRTLGILLLKIVLAAVYGALVVMLPPEKLFMLILPVVVMLLVVLWMLPDRTSFPLGAIERFFPTYLVLMVIWPTYLAVALPGLPWMTPTRIFLFILTFLMLFSIATSGALRHHLYTIARSNRGLWTALLIWQVTLFITLPFSQTIGISIKMVFDDEIRLAGMFFLGCLIFTRQGAATKTLRMLIILAVLCSLEGFVELRMEHPPWADYIPAFLRADEGAINNALGSQARFVDGLYRVRGPFSGSLILAEYLAYCVPFIIHWMVTGRTVLVRLSMIPVFLIVFASILVTQSRLGLVGALAAVMAYVPIWAWRKWRSDKTAVSGPLVLLGAPVFAIMLLGLVLSSRTLSTRVFGGGAQAASTEARAAQRRMAVPKVIANPIGHGTGQSGQVLGFVNLGGYMTIDNHYLTTVLDLGVVGLFAFYGMFGFATWSGIGLYIRARNREMELAGPLSIMFLEFFVIKSVLSEEVNHALVFLLLGMMMALKARDIRAQEPGGNTPHPVLSLT